VLTCNRINKPNNGKRKPDQGPTAKHIAKMNPPDFSKVRGSLLGLDTNKLIKHQNRIMGLLYVIYNSKICHLLILMLTKWKELKNVKFKVKKQCNSQGFGALKLIKVD
jgi:hypothetical protein